VLRVTERYLCLEGEGRTLGAATYLIRLSGCDLRCWWCDSKFSSFREDEAKAVAWKALLAEAKASGAAWVSFTGGEPTWRGPQELKSLTAFCQALKRAGLKLKVESNGRRWLKELDGLIDLWSLAPKWDGRHGALTDLMRYELPALKRYVRKAAPAGLQLKFVITYDKQAPRAGDLEMAAGLLKKLGAKAKRTPVFFIPEAYATGDYLGRCKALEAEMPRLLKKLKGFDLRVQPQWHRVLHGDERGV
jgi:organic radical activating enzyme